VYLRFFVKFLELDLEEIVSRRLSGMIAPLKFRESERTTFVEKPQILREIDGNYEEDQNPKKERFLVQIGLKRIGKYSKEEEIDSCKFFLKFSI
jgi:hypothetical protein